MKTRFTIRQLIAYFVILACCLFWVLTLGVVDSLALFFVISLTIYCVIFPPLIKHQLLKTLSDDMAVAAVKEEEFPLLDRARLKTLHQELSEIGFSPAQDFTMHHPTTKIIPVFASSWLHENGTCYAEVSQYFPALKAQPMTLTFISFFGEGPPQQSPLQSPATTSHAPLPAPGAPSHELERQAAAYALWTYSTTNAPHRTLLRTLRRPRNLSRRMVNAGTRQMYEKHLADRAKIAAHLQLPIAGELTFQRYFNWAMLSRRAFRWQVRHQNYYLALLRAFFNKSETWWGELGRDFEKFEPQMDTDKHR